MRPRRCCNESEEGLQDEDADKSDFKSHPFIGEAGKVRCHFWQDGGGYDRNIISPQALWSTIQYIHANPVRRGLVGHPSEWEWSSARWWNGEDDVKLVMDGDRSISL